MKFQLLMMTLLSISHNYCFATWREQIDHMKLAGPVVSIQGHVINGKNQLLLGRLKKTGEWCLPISQMSKDDDTINSTITRMVLEETGIIVQSSTLYNNSTVTVHHNSGEKDKLLRVLCIVKNFIGEPKVTNPESDYDAWYWFDKDEIPHNLHAFILPQDQLKNLVK